MIRVAIFASGMALRIGLRQMMGSLPEVEVVAEASRPENLPPVDIWVLASADLLPRDSNHPALLLLSDQPADASRLANYHLWGILPLEAGPGELEAALRALGEGLCVGAPALLGRLLRPKVDSADLTPQPLTGRELEILQLAAEGLSTAIS